MRLDLPEFKSYNRKHWRRERQNSGTWQLAWRKDRLIRDELIMHQSWTGLDKGLQSSDLWRMDSVQQMASFVQLWDLVQQVVLSDEQDQTAWKKTVNKWQAYYVRNQPMTSNFQAVMDGQRELFRTWCPTWQSGNGELCNFLLCMENRIVGTADADAE